MSIVESGKAAVERVVKETVPDGKTLAVVAVADQDGKMIRGALQLNNKTGEWEFYGELAKLKDRKSTWEVGVLWSI